MKIIIAGALISCGLWLLYSTRKLIGLGWSSSSWPKAEGKIIDSESRSFSIPGASTRSSGLFGGMEYRETDLIYEYVVNGREYRSSTYCFGAWMERAGKAHRVGRRVSVYYDPEHPEVSVLKPGLQFGALFGLVPISAGIAWACLASY